MDEMGGAERTSIAELQVELTTTDGEVGCVDVDFCLYRGSCEYRTQNSTKEERAEKVDVVCFCYSQLSFTSNFNHFRYSETSLLTMFKHCEIEDDYKNIGNSIQEQQCSTQSQT